MSIEIEKEIEELTKKIEGEPNNAEYYYLRGIQYDWLGEGKKYWEKCHEDFGKAFELQPDNMVYLTYYTLTSEDILLHLGVGLLPFIENCNNFAEKIKNLRANLKNVLNGSDVYIPVIQIMDNPNIKPLEAIMYADKKVIFQKELSVEKKENILDEIVDILEKVFSREYLKIA